MIKNFLRLGADVLTPAPRRSKLLERLLASPEGVSELTDWRTAALRALSPESVPAVAPVLLLASQARAAHRAPAASAWVWVATPVHLEPGLDNVRLPADGIVRLSPEEALQLADDFGRLWVGAPFRLEAIAEALYLLSSDPVPAATHDPEVVRGDHIDEYLPVGAGASRLKALMSEVEMWLFEHPVNRERSRLGRSTVSGLWFWGGGERIERLPTTEFQARGEDPLLAAFGNEGKETRVVVASHAPGSREWGEFEEPWLRSSLSALKSAERLAISLGRHCFLLKRGWHWHPLRSNKAWWEYFE